MTNKGFNPEDTFKAQCQLLNEQSDEDMLKFAGWAALQLVKLAGGVSGSTEGIVKRHAGVHSCVVSVRGHVCTIAVVTPSSKEVIPAEERGLALTALQNMGCGRTVK